MLAILLNTLWTLSCLQESLAEYVIMWDDDIQPSATCLAAYVQAFKEHGKVRLTQPMQSDFVCSHFGCSVRLE